MHVYNSDRCMYKSLLEDSDFDRFNQLWIQFNNTQRFDIVDNMYQIKCEFDF